MLQRELDGDDVKANERLKADTKEHQDLGYSSRTQQTDSRQTQQCQGNCKNHEWGMFLLAALLAGTAALALRRSTQRRASAPQA